MGAIQGHLATDLNGQAATAAAAPPATARGWGAITFDCLLTGLQLTVTLAMALVVLPETARQASAGREQRRQESERLKTIDDLQRRIILNNARIIARQEELLRRTKGE